MNHNNETAVRPKEISFSEFGVEYENQFILLDDAEHVIGIDPNNGKKLIFKNVENGSTVKFEDSNSSENLITTLVYDKNTGTLYCGDDNGQLLQYKVDIATKTCKIVNNNGKLKIGLVTSSHRFLDFVFFGGIEGKIKVLDLSTGKLLEGLLKTSVKVIRSLQVCVKSHTEIFLAVSGRSSNYSDDKTDLFDVSGLLPTDPVILKNLYSENSINKDKIILEQRSRIKFLKETIQILRKESNFNKNKLNEIKKKYFKMLEKKTELSLAYNKLKGESDLKTKNYLKKINFLYQQKSKKAIIDYKNSLIQNGIFDEMDPLIIIRDLKKDIEEKIYKNNRLENSMFDVLVQKKKN